MSKKNFMKAMGRIEDKNLNRYAQFEKTLELKSKKNRILRVIALAACLAILIAAIPVSLYFRDDKGGEQVIEHDYFVMNGADVQYLTSREFNSTRIPGKVSDEFRNAAASFAFELLKESSRADYEGDSLLVSPLSVMLALSMTANGAEDRTLEQLEKVLGGEMDIEELNEQLFNYTSSLVSTDDAKFNLANAVWVTSAPFFSVNKQFISRIEDTFDADIVAADLTKPSVIDEINSWVKEETFDMIDGILNDGDLTEDSIMVLLNAIAFDAIWEVTVEDDKCYEDIFRGMDGDSTATFMKTIADEYIAGENEIGFIKNYAGKNYAFLALLPDEDIAIGDYVNSLSGEKFLELYDAPVNISYDVDAIMPHFTNDCSIDMNSVLAKMGIKDAFDRECANFAGLGKTPKDKVICIDKVLHKTHIELDNKGTRAAAATSVGMIVVESMSVTKTVTLDRPFVYAIIDTETGLPIFLGVCENIN